MQINEVYCIRRGKFRRNLRVVWISWGFQAPLPEVWERILGRFLKLYFSIALNSLIGIGLPNK